MGEDYSKKVKKGAMEVEILTDVQLMKEAKETDDLERLEFLARHPNIFVRGAVAKNPCITPEIVEILSKVEPDRFDLIEKSLEGNPKFPSQEGDKIRNIIKAVRSRFGK